MRNSLLFPGQGSQVVGMGFDLFNVFDEAKELFLFIDEVLKQKLSDLMFYGDQEELTLTYNAQPAIMAVSLAVMEVLKKQLNVNIEDICNVAAGHSLGEYSALASSGAISVKDTALLLRIRGNAMQLAVKPGYGAMLALIGAEFQNACDLAISASKHGICQVANDNGAGQIVLSGSAEAIEQAMLSATEFGIKKAIKLKVSAPFHSSFMSPAATQMEDALRDINIQPTKIDVIANFNVEKHTADNTKELLVRQIAGSVRWRETMEKLHAQYNITRFIEVGPGQVLSGIAKRMYKDIDIFNLHTPQSIEEFSKKVINP